MSDKNPFSRAIRAKTEEPKEDVRDSAAVIRDRTNLRQADSEADGGHAEDTPSAVSDNEDAAEDVGAELGLGALDFVSAKDRVEVDDSSGDPPPSIADSPEDRIAAGRGASQASIDGVSTQDALDAASGADNTDVTDLVGTGNPRDFVDAAKADRNPLNDPLIAASMAAVDEASDTTSSKLSVAADDVGVAVAAAAGALGGTAAASVAGATVGIVGAGAVGAAVATVGVAAAGGAVVGAGVYLANDASGGKLGDAVMQNIGVIPVVGAAVQLAAGAANTVGEIAVAASDVAAGAATPSQAVANVVSGTSAAGSTGAAGSTKGGGTKLTDPDADGPPSEAEMAFVQASKDALGIRRIPGDIDPGEGDGTQSHGPLDEAQAARIVATKTNESLVGNPGDPGRRQGSSLDINQEAPALGGTRQGGDIDPEEGSAFTGSTRTEGPEDVNFTVGSQPLVGFEENDEDEEEDDDDDDDDGAG